MMKYIYDSWIMTELEMRDPFLRVLHLGTKSQQFRHNCQSFSTVEHYLSTEFSPQVLMLSKSSELASLICQASTMTPLHSLTRPFWPSSLQRPFYIPTFLLFFCFPSSSSFSSPSYSSSFPSSSSSNPPGSRLSLLLMSWDTSIKEHPPAGKLLQSPKSYMY